jgi:hypothetical protein
MALLKKKVDPISHRARELNDEIAELAAEIKKLDTRLQKNHERGHPRLRSTAIPHAGTVNYPTHAVEQVAAHTEVEEEPIFEEVGQDLLKAKTEATTAEHFNELGVRKYDLPAMFGRLRNHFRGPSTTNPKLVSYLAAGGIQGLRPMRYEKRVARNRFIALVLILFLTLLGIIAVFVRHRG